MKIDYDIENGVLKVLTDDSEEDLIEAQSGNITRSFATLKPEAIDRLFFAMSFVMKSDEINSFKETILNGMERFTNVSKAAKETMRKILGDDNREIIFLDIFNLNLDNFTEEDILNFSGQWDIDVPEVRNALQLICSIKDKCLSLNISDMANREEFEKIIENLSSYIKLEDAIPVGIINEICYLLVSLMPPEVIIEIISGLFISGNLYLPVQEYSEKNKIISNENFNSLVYEIYTTLFVNLLVKDVQFKEIIESINFKLKAEEVLEKITDKEICKEINDNKILKKLFHDFLKFFNNNFFNDREGEIVLNLFVKYSSRNPGELRASDDLQIILNYFRKKSTNIESNAIPNLESDDLTKTSQEKC